MSDDPCKPRSAVQLSPRPAPVVRAASVAIVAGTTIALLTFGSAFLIPVAEALIIWSIFNSLARRLRKAPGLGRILSSGAAISLAAGLVTFIGIAVIYVVAGSVLRASPQAASLQASLEPLIEVFARKIGTETANVVDYLLDRLSLQTLVQTLALGLLGLINHFGVVAIFVAFLIADQVYFEAKLEALFRDPERRGHARALLSDINRRVGTYLWIMVRVSLLTAALSYLVMAAVGLANADFWAVLIFFLNFIPTIGAILGTALPAMFGLVQFDGLQGPLFLVAGIGAVQFVTGNILLPRMAGKSLNLSMFVTIFALFFWGTIWGVTGMFLAVPMTAILVIILARFEATRPVAILLSKTGLVGPEPVAAITDDAPSR